MATPYQIQTRLRAVEYSPSLFARLVDRPRVGLPSRRFRVQPVCRRQRHNWYNLRTVTLNPRSNNVSFHGARTEGNKWMGPGSPTKRDSLVAESRNMSALGGADHARAEGWSELELPMSGFMMRARHVLRR